MSEKSGTKKKDPAKLEAELLQPEFERVTAESNPKEKSDRNVERTVIIIPSFDEASDIFFKETVRSLKGYKTVPVTSTHRQG